MTRTYLIIFFTCVCFSTDMHACDTVQDKQSIDVKQRIFLYETLKNYQSSDANSIEDFISKSILDEKQKDELKSLIKEKLELKVSLTYNLLYPLTNRSIPIEYAIKEIEDLEKKGLLDEKIVTNIKAARSLDYSYESIFEFLKEKIESKQKKAKIN